MKEQFFDVLIDFYSTESVQKLLDKIMKMR